MSVLGVVTVYSAYPSPKPRPRADTAPAFHPDPLGRSSLSPLVVTDTWFVHLTVSASSPDSTTSAIWPPEVYRLVSTSSG